MNSQGYRSGMPFWTSITRILSRNRPGKERSIRHSLFFLLMLFVFFSASDGRKNQKKKMIRKKSR
jgi:hypothetical protein